MYVVAVATKQTYLSAESTQMTLLLLCFRWLLSPPSCFVESVFCIDAFLFFPQLLVWSFPSSSPLCFLATHPAFLYLSLLPYSSVDGQA